MQGLRGMYVDCAFGQLHAAVDSCADGDSEPILLLNPRPRSLWQLLGHLRPRYRGIIVDIPGWGGPSSPPPVDASIESVAQCLCDVLDALAIERTHLFGMHTGNKIVAAFGSEHSERTGDVILAGKTHSIVVDQRARNEAMRKTIEKRLPDWCLSELEGKYIDEQPYERAQKETIYRANFAFDLERALTRITAKTLVLEITSDAEDASIGRQAENLVALLSHGRALTLPQIEPTGVDFYAGADRVAVEICSFLAEGSSRNDGPM